MPFEPAGANHVGNRKERRHTLRPELESDVGLVAGPADLQHADVGQSIRVEPAAQVPNVQHVWVLHVALHRGAEGIPSHQTKVVLYWCVRILVALARIVSTTHWSRSALAVEAPASLRS